MDLLKKFTKNEKVSENINKEEANETDKSEQAIKDNKESEHVEAKEDKSLGITVKEEKVSKWELFKKKIKKIVLCIIAIVIAFFAIVICYFKLPVSKYYSASDRTFKIPQISKGFIPQGLSYDSSAGDFYITGYTKDHTASPIYIVDKDTGKVRKNILMANPDGSEFTGHNGGIEAFNGRIYVAGSSDSCLYVYDPSNIRETDNGELLAYESTVDLSFGGDELPVAFVTSYKDQLIAGEFYRKIVYPTNENHWVKTKNGTNKAIAVSFNIDGDKATPNFVYSLPDQVQGMYIDDDSIYLSISYGVAFSHILRYSKSDVVQNGTIKVMGKDLPLYILSDENLASDTKIAPMSEEIVIAGGKMYTMCESASDKYIFGKLTGARKCYATDIALFR